jgi:nucleotide-binding universal stress UspA family protein
MIKLENILVPTDLDENSNHALAYGRELAATYGATLHLFHVVESNWSGPLTMADFPGQMDFLHTILFYGDIHVPTETSPSLIHSRNRESIILKTACVPNASKVGLQQDWTTAYLR